MKISTEQLSSQLNPLLPAYLISGDEILLVEEACDLIRESAKKNGFDERKIFHVDAKFDWSQLIEASCVMSLFSEKEIIELRIPSGKINEAGKKALEHYLEKTYDDKILLIITGKLAGTTLNTKWAKQLDKIGAIAQAWPVPANQFPAWIKNRLKNKGLTATPEAVQFISDQTEGNLLAAKQEVEKLYLLYGEKKLSIDDVMNAVADTARYDVFQLMDQFLLGNQKQSLRILNTLKNEGVEPTIILWAFAREIRSLITMANQLKNLTVDAVMSKQFVWEKRKPMIRAALKRNTLSGLEGLLNQSAHIDRMIKGLMTGNVWDEFERMIVR